MSIPRVPRISTNSHCFRPLIERLQSFCQRLQSDIPTIYSFKHQDSKKDCYFCEKYLRKVKKKKRIENIRILGISI